MIRRSNITALAAALTLSLVAAAPAHAGPPWISAEFPANPHEAVTRGAFLLVHTYHHGTPSEFGLTGTAEGLVNGRRQTMPLEIVPTGKPGVFAVRFKPQGSGAWVLAFKLGKENAAGMLVALNKDGEPATVRVPSSTAEGGRWIIPRALNPQDIDAALRTQTALNAAGGQNLGLGNVPAGAMVALGLVLGVPLMRRLRTRG
jgi:hypothetical protein